jgi:hypothetical protein
MKIVQGASTGCKSTTARLLGRSIVAVAVLTGLLMFGLAGAAWTQESTIGVTEKTTPAGDTGQPVSILQKTMEDTWNTVEGYLPRMLGALGVLILGTILAWIIAGIARWALGKLSLNKRLTSCLPGGPEAEKVKALNSARWISIAVFWLLELIVIIQFFGILKLTEAASTLGKLQDQIWEYLPKVLGAALILLVAWVVAGVLRFIITRALLAAKFDERFRKQAPEGEAPKWSLSAVLGNTVYWLVFVLSLSAVFSKLDIKGLSDPTSQMMTKVMDFLPNLFIAAVILVVGWLIARLLQQIAVSFLTSVGVNQLGERVGLGKVMGEHRISDLIGLVVYVLILIPVAVATLDALQLKSLTEPASRMLDQFLLKVPALFEAVVILIVAWVVGRLLSNITASLLAGIGFDRLPAKLGLGGPKTETAVGGKSNLLSQVCGYIVLVAVMLIAVLAVLSANDLRDVSDLVKQFLVYLGSVALAVVTMGLGLYVAALAARAIQASKITYATSLSNVARVAIIGVATAMALVRIGLGTEIVVTAFTLVLGAVAVAAAIAFGIGGRDLAKQQLEEWSRKMKEKKG